MLGSTVCMYVAIDVGRTTTNSEVLSMVLLS